MRRSEIRYVSMFSGIEAATVAWDELGWKPVVFSDFEAFPKAVLAHHYPDVPDLGDVTEVDWSEYRGKADLVVGGSPCQSFSVAGSRLGMDDPRGNLALHFLGAIKDIQPKWFIFENVPGLLSSDGGRDFATFLGQVCELGYGFAYRVLDAQYFGVPQRRRRLFVVGHIGGDWRSAAAVLFERESLCGNPPPSEEAGQSLASFTGEGADREDDSDRGGVIGPSGVTYAIHDKATRHKGGEKGTRFRRHSEGDGGGNGLGISDEGVAYTLTGGDVHFVGQPTENKGEFWNGEDKATTITTRSHLQSMPDKDNFLGVVEEQEPVETVVYDARGNGEGDTSATLVGDHQSRVSDYTSIAVEGTVRSPTLTSYNLDSRSPQSEEQQRLVGAVFKTSHVVRRLTPIECERLQGFPDNYTRIPWRGKPAEKCPDGPRYKVLGNSMAVPVMKWIAMGIQAVDEVLDELEDRPTSVNIRQPSIFEF